MAHNHLADIRAGCITRTNIAGIRKALSANWRNERGYSNGVTAPIGSQRIADQLPTLLQRYHPTAIGPLHDSGLAVLRSPRWRKRFTDAQRAVIDEPYIRFDLVRFDDVGRGNFVPVWRVISFAGSFTFRNISWQSAWALGLESGPTIVTEQTP